ncbi:hypothetical protein J7F95_005231, partial [Escherichia coli]|nr:hypothetical protein [Escherichia coli]
QHQPLQVHQLQQLCQQQQEQQELLWLPLPVHPVQLALQQFHQVWQRLVPLLVVEWLLAL